MRRYGCDSSACPFATMPQFLAEARRRRKDSLSVRARAMEGDVEVPGPDARGLRPVTGASLCFRHRPPRGSGRLSRTFPVFGVGTVAARNDASTLRMSCWIAALGALPDQRSCPAASPFHLRERPASSLKTPPRCGLGLRGSSRTVTWEGDRSWSHFPARRGRSSSRTLEIEVSSVGPHPRWRQIIGFKINDLTEEYGRHPLRGESLIWPCHLFRHREEQAQTPEVGPGTHAHKTSARQQSPDDLRR